MTLVMVIDASQKSTISCHAIYQKSREVVFAVIINNTIERPHSKPPVEAAVIFRAVPAGRPRPPCSASHRAAPFRPRPLTDTCGVNNSIDAEARNIDTGPIIDWTNALWPTKPKFWVDRGPPGPLYGAPLFQYFTAGRYEDHV